MARKKSDEGKAVKASSFISKLEKAMGEVSFKAYSFKNKRAITKEMQEMLYNDANTDLNKKLKKDYFNLIHLCEDDPVLFRKIVAQLKAKVEGSITAHFFCSCLLRISANYAKARTRAQTRHNKEAITSTGKKGLGLTGTQVETWIKHAVAKDKEKTLAGKENEPPLNILQKIARIQTPVALGQGLSYLIGAGHWFLRRGLTATSFPVIMGPVAIKNADEIELARSGKVLKFRATGSIFLASQKGGTTDAIIVRGIISKWDITTFLAIWSLYSYGQGRVREFQTGEDPNKWYGSVIKQYEAGQEPDLSKMKKLHDTQAIDETMQKSAYEYHRTFAVVTRHFIIPNCYIETFSFEEKLPFKDVVQFSIMLRTFEKHNTYDMLKEADDRGRTLVGHSKRICSAQRVLEYAINTFWRIMGASGMWVDENEWKIGDARQAGKLDTYYNIGIESIASAMMMGVMGVI